MFSALVLTLDIWGKTGLVLVQGSSRFCLDLEKWLFVRMQPIYDPNVLWSSDIFTDFECAYPRFSESVQIVGPKIQMNSKFLFEKV